MAVRSFFKYNDLPLGMVSIAKTWVKYHNRDITKIEIKEILNISSPRERAFFSVMEPWQISSHYVCYRRIFHKILFD